MPESYQELRKARRPHLYAHEQPPVAERSPSAFTQLVKTLRAELAPDVARALERRGITIQVSTAEHPYARTQYVPDSRVILVYYPLLKTAPDAVIRRALRAEIGAACGFDGKRVERLVAE